MFHLQSFRWQKLRELEKRHLNCIAVYFKLQLDLTFSSVQDLKMLSTIIMIVKIKSLYEFPFSSSCQLSVVITVINDFLYKFVRSASFKKKYESCYFLYIILFSLIFYCISIIMNILFLLEIQ